MSLFESILKHGEPTDHDIAALADWAEENERTVLNKDWKLAFHEMRVGADRLLRRRSRSKDE